MVSLRIKVRRRLLSLAAFAALGITSWSTANASQQSAGVGPFASARIGVVTRGQGPDIILVPGLAAHRDVWADVASQMDRRYRLHLVQINGFAGFAARANADGPIAAPIADEIRRYIRVTGLRRPAVIGHSMGGTIGLVLAARHPEIVGRLMVVDTTPFAGLAFGPPGATAESVRTVADDMRAKILAEPPGSPRGILAQMISGMTRSEAMRSRLQQYARDSDRRVIANALHEGIVTDLRPELARIRAAITVLYVHPPGVPMSPAQFDAAVRESFRNAPRTRFVKIEDSNHYIQLDQRVRFVAEVDAFMR